MFPRAAEIKWPCSSITTLKLKGGICHFQVVDATLWFQGGDITYPAHKANIKDVKPHVKTRLRPALIDWKPRVYTRFDR